MGTIRRAVASRKVVGGVSAAVAGILVVASMAWACTVPEGFTWYSDGSTSKSGPAGTTITAFATGALRNTSYFLVTGKNESGQAHADHACMDSIQNVNDTQRFSNNRGFIGNTSGPVNRTQGTWQVCFRTPDGAYSTLAVLFTVT
jgi:hypothetical protein